MSKYSCLIFVYVGLIFITGCNNNEINDEGISTEQDHLIEITKEQFIADSMMIEDLTMHPFYNKVLCDGYVKAPVDGIAELSVKMSGLVDRIYYLPGEFVKKGQTLCSISSQELIILQQEYLESLVKLKKLKYDYDRVKALYEENIGAKKDFIAVESEFEAIELKVRSLKLQLQQLNLNVADIETERFYTTFPVIAPISGFIIQQDIVIGQYLEKQDMIMEIVDNNKLQLELAVFEKDIYKLQKGQKVYFNSLGEAGVFHSATLISVGKSINNESKTIQCFAKIDQERDVDLINQSFIEASIHVGEMKAKAIPTEALLELDEEYYVLLLERTEAKSYFFRKEKVQIGQTSGNYTEILNNQELKDVCTKGVYNLSIE